MFRNQYDTDVTVWSPQGKLHQVDYAIEAVKQGSACLGLVSNKYAILAAHKRAPAVELSSHQDKIFKIDSHIGIGIAGLTADARSLAKYMRMECLNHRYVYGSRIQAGRLVNQVADKHQQCTQMYVRRPYGVGLLVAAVDQTGPHLYQTCPSGNFWEYKAIAIGARSQSAKTYLEKHFQTFPSLEKDELIKHALHALVTTLQGDTELTAKNTTISIVGVGHDFTILEGESLQPYLDMVEVSTGGDNDDVDDDEAKMDTSA